jgi:hypothetical protein
MGRRRKGSATALGASHVSSERGLGLAGVEASLEVAPYRLPAREDEVVARPARWELHDPDVVVTFPVTAGVRCGLVEGSQTVALPPS